MIFTKMTNIFVIGVFGKSSDRDFSPMSQLSSGWEDDLIILRAEKVPYTIMLKKERYI
jgi:hypothetical protein